MKSLLFRILRRIIQGVKRLEHSIKKWEILSHPNVQIENSFFKNSEAYFNIGSEKSIIKFEEGVNCRKFCNFLVWPNGRLLIEKNVFFNNYCSINCLDSIEIGENTMFGEGVKIYDHNHAYEYVDSALMVSPDNFSTKGIKIGRNCWIGSNVTILKGVNIGDNTIIGANCLIFKSIEPNSIIMLNQSLTRKEK